MISVCECLWCLCVSVIPSVSVGTIPPGGGRACLPSQYIVNTELSVDLGTEIAMATVTMVTLAIFYLPLLSWYK